MSSPTRPQRHIAERNDVRFVAVAKGLSQCKEVPVNKCDSTLDFKAHSPDYVVMTWEPRRECTDCTFDNR